MATTTEPLTVELPVCPKCGLVGKLPAHITRKDWCNGGAGKSHKVAKMERRVFREVREDEEESS